MNPAQPSPLMSFLPIAAIFAIFYFLIIRPQQKQMKEHQKMLEGLAKGDRVLTNGGIYGTIVALKGPDLEVKISDEVKVTVSRACISKLANPKAELVGANGSDRQAA